MNTLQQFDDNNLASSLRGLRYARLAGYVLSVLLFSLGIAAVIKSQGTFEMFKGVYFVVYAMLLSVPYGRLSDRVWRWSYGLLVLLSALFVFVMIAVVMFAYMAAAERGERLGIPGFEGMLIFFALLQLPVVLFQRKPDMLD